MGGLERQVAYLTLSRLSEKDQVEEEVHEKDRRDRPSRVKQVVHHETDDKNEKDDTLPTCITPNTSITSNASRETTIQRERLQARLKDQCRRVRYLLCLDVEATCNEAYGFGEYPNEIIELPCVIYDLDECVEVDHFRTYVRPTHQPVLSDFCCMLTGITQEQVDAAPEFPTALHLLEKFLSGHADRLHPAPHTMQHAKDGEVTDYTVPPPTSMTASKRKFFGIQNERHRQRPKEVDRNWAWTTDGRWDIEDFIMRKQLKTTGPARLPLWMSGSYVDVRMLFGEHFKQKSNKNLEAMLAQCNLRFQGRQHSGLADARNVAIVARELQEHGCLIETNRWVSFTGATGLVHKRQTRSR